MFVCLQDQFRGSVIVFNGLIIILVFQMHFVYEQQNQSQCKHCLFKNATKSTKQFMLCITCVKLLLPYSLFSVVSSSLSFQDHYFVVSLLIHPTLSQTFFYLYFVSVVSKVCFNLNSTLCSFFVFVDIYVNQEFHTIHKIHFKHGASLTSLCLLLFCCWEA